MLKPYMTDKVVNLQGRDLLQLWRAQINILTISETAH